MNKNDKLLDNPDFLERNKVNESELTQEEKDSAVNYNELTEEEKQELDELLKKQSERPLPSWGKPRRKISAKEYKAKKKKRRTANASRRKNRRK